MDLTIKTKISELLKEYPFLIDFLPTISTAYKKLKNPILRKTIGKTATLEMVAAMGDIEPLTLISKIKSEINKTGSNQTDLADKRKQQLKEIIRDLHKGEDMEVLKQRFAKLIKDVSPSEISEMEQSLIDEGMPEEEIKRLCDVHVEVFKQSLEKQKIPETKPGHPIHTFMLENREIEKILSKFDPIIKKLGDEPDKKTFESHKKNLKDIVDILSGIDLHYLRKENQLFPVLETHNISGPSQVMWAIHDDIRAEIKKLKKEISQSKTVEVMSTVKNLKQMITDMIYKEENILFPMSLESFSEKDWLKVKKGEEEIGYAWVKPGTEWKPRETISEVEQQKQGMLSLDTGSLSLEHINLMLKHLPVDLSFVNDKDEVAYYSDTSERIFPRSAAVIGRKVQKCHPPKSVHVVDQILKEFKKGKKDVAEFWIQLGGKFLHIRYFAIRDKNKKYIGTLEVSQDITEIKKLDGQRGLLDWS
jgi:hypothetical protein